MAKVTNTSKKNHAVTLPDGTTLKPRESVDIPSFGEQYGSNAVVKAWRKAGVITVMADALAPKAPLNKRVAFDDAPKSL